MSSGSGDFWSHGFCGADTPAGEVGEADASRRREGPAAVLPLVLLAVTVVLLMLWVHAAWQSGIESLVRFG